LITAVILFLAVAGLVGAEAGGDGGGDETRLRSNVATPVMLKFLIGASAQLPERPVGAGTRATFDPSRAPSVTRATIVGTMPPSEALQVIVDVSPLFQVMGIVPLALPTRPLAPTEMQPRVPVPEKGPLSPV
jgi:hypothetical protein